MSLNRSELYKGYFFCFILVVMIFLINNLSSIFIDGRIALILAISWILFSVFIYFILRKNQKGLRVYSVLNAIISGIAMSSYYTLEDINLFNPMIILAIFGLVMIIDYMMMNKIKTIKFFIKIKIILLILILIGCIYIWLTYSSSYGSGLTFMTIILLSINISLLLIQNKEVNYTVIVGLASLLMFGGILVCILVALTEGEVLDILTFDSWENNKKKIN
ncbi:hypothetical protein AN1V17_16170 [Vallitalea sediminicola]